MGWLDKLLGREKKAGGDGTGEASRSEGMKEPPGMSEPKAPAEAPPAAQREKEAES